jgi:hypothetical protein
MAVATGRYSCSLRGQCEVDPEGPYTSEQECLNDCQSTANRDTTLVSLSYAPAEASYVLAPSERVELLRQLTGIEVPKEQSGDYLRSLGGNLVLLAKDERFRDYLIPHLDLYPLPRQAAIGFLRALLIDDKGNVFSGRQNTYTEAWSWTHIPSLREIEFVAMGVVIDRRGIPYFFDEEEWQATPLPDGEQAYQAAADRGVDVVLTLTGRIYQRPRGTGALQLQQYPVPLTDLLNRAAVLGTDDRIYPLIAGGLTHPPGPLNTIRYRSGRYRNLVLTLTGLVYWRSFLVPPDSPWQLLELPELIKDISTLYLEFCLLGLSGQLYFLTDGSERPDLATVSGPPVALLSEDSVNTEPLVLGADGYWYFLVGRNRRRVRVILPLH